jgi:hypothetical protein
MSRNQKDETFDYSTRLKDAGLVAASAAATVGGSAQILDLGASRVDGRVLIDISAIEVATGDEKYTILVQGSDSATFAGTTHKNLGAVVVGDSSTSLEGVDSGTGRRELAFTNEVNGHVFQYVRVYTQVVGTIATGINFTANLVKKA